MTEQPVRRIAIDFASAEELAAELEANLRRGVVVAKHAEGLEAGDSCNIVLLHPDTGHMLGLSGYVAGAAATSGFELHLEPFGGEELAQLESFVDIHAGLGSVQERALTSSMPEPPPPEPEAELAQEGAEEELEPEAEAASDAEAPVEHEPEGETDEEGAEALAELEAMSADQISKGLPEHIYSRLRKIPQHMVHKIARSGRINERVAIERIYGKNIWEALLQNPNLTPPEVARIARMGTLPKPLIDTIVNHPGWVTKPLIRRALLSNPRLSGRSLMKVLKSIPKPELKLIPQQSAYPYKVREAAKRIIGSS